MAGFLIAIISGALMSLQGAFNTGVSKSAGIWVTAMLVQATALITCIVMWFFNNKPNVMNIFKVENKLMLLGGVIGAFITITVVLSIAKLGIAKAEVTIVVAQIVVSYIIELLGLFGSEKTSFSIGKALALLIAVVGVYMFYSNGSATKS